MDNPTCRWCGDKRSKYTVAQHERTCLSSPDVWAAVQAALESDEAGVGVSAGAYRRRVRGLGLPSQDTLTHRLGGWDDVLRAFGLQPPRRAMQQTKAQQEARWQEVERGLDAYMQWAQAAQRAEKYGEVHDDTSVVEQREDGALVRRFAGGAAWELPTPQQSEQRGAET